MKKNEVLELKKQLSHENCTISKICGCYVDAEKNVKAKFSDTFLCLPEQESFKYFEIFKKTLSGTIGKNLLNINFDEKTSDFQNFLLKLKDSELKEDLLVDQFYNKIIDSYSYSSNYLILIIYAVYDVPGKGTDKINLGDSSEEIYSHIICSICPVSLSKAGLSYNMESNHFQERLRDWYVDVPLNGFLFPAFNDRSSDADSALFYTKNAKCLDSGLLNDIFGSSPSLSVDKQKEGFQSLIEETLGNTCNYEVVKTIHEKISEIIEDHEFDLEPVSLNKTEIKTIFSDCGVDDESLQHFDTAYDSNIGEAECLLPTNIINPKALEIKSSSVMIKVSPNFSSSISTTIVDGKKYLLIEAEDNISINGIKVLF